MLQEAVRGGANAWMAYDWVYPPPKGGESLIHLDWGKDYRLTKIYQLFRQWSLAVPWDAQVLETDRTGKALANAFLAKDGSVLVVLVLNPEAGPLPLRLRVKPGFNA